MINNKSNQENIMIETYIPDIMIFPQFHAELYLEKLEGYTILKLEEKCIFKLDVTI